MASNQLADVCPSCGTQDRVVVQMKVKGAAVGPVNMVKVGPVPKGTPTL